MKFVALAPEHWDWVQQHVGILQAPDAKGIVALDAKSQIAGVIVGERWVPASCIAHIAVPNPMAIRRGLIEEWYRYVFVTAERRAMLGIIRSDMPKSLNLVRHLGWRELYRHTDGYAQGVDLVHFEYMRAQWLSREVPRWAA